MFKASDFGDELDRPLKKSDGSWTYFATDMAYHLDKFQRGFKTMIDVWGADHGVYVKRMIAAVHAVAGRRGVDRHEEPRRSTGRSGSQPLRRRPLVNRMRRVAGGAHQRNLRCHGGTP